MTKWLWKWTPIEKLTREELEDALIEMSRLYDRELDYLLTK